VFAECLAAGLACRDQRRHMGSSSALEALCDDALYKYTFSLLYFTAYLSATDCLRFPHQLEIPEERT